MKMGRCTRWFSQSNHTMVRESWWLPNCNRKPTQIYVTIFPSEWTGEKSERCSRGPLNLSWQAHRVFQRPQWSHTSSAREQQLLGRRSWPPVSSMDSRRRWRTWLSEPVSATRPSASKKSSDTPAKETGEAVPRYKPSFNSPNCKPSAEVQGKMLQFIVDSGALMFRKWMGKHPA